LLKFTTLITVILVALMAMNAMILVTNAMHPHHGVPQLPGVLVKSNLESDSCGQLANHSPIWVLDGNFLFFVCM
jgi:hypothetical protein